MRGGEQENVNRAQEFCQQNRDWLVKTCSQHLNLAGVHGHVMSAKECADDVFLKCGKITDEAWSGVKNPFGYVAQMAINRANEVAKHEALTEKAVKSCQWGHFIPPLQEFDLMLEEILARLTDDQLWLFEMVFIEQLEREAICERMGLSDDALRQRFHRLQERMRALRDERIAHPPRKAGA